MKFDFDLLSNPLFVLKKLQRDKIRKYAGFLKEYLLDVGCGIKPYQRLVRCEVYIGLDECIEVHPNIKGCALNLPFAINTFDSIICSEVLEYIKQPKEVLAEIHRVLRPEGVVYITAPMCWCLHYEPDDYWRFTNYSLVYLIKSSGFELIKMERIGGIFSLVGVRLADVYYTTITKFLSFLPPKQVERISAALSLPVSILFYCLGLLFDEIDKRDAIGWMVLARKENIQK